MRKLCNHGIKSLVLGALLLMGNRMEAQDIHFSQFYASPLTLNPALTGKVDGNYRIAGIYRSQWGGIPSTGNDPAYATPSGSFDLPIFVGKKKLDAVGLGALLVDDYSNAANYGVITGMLSASYIKSLGKNGKHQLSIGLQGGIQQAKTGTFTFADQYPNGVFSESTPSYDAGFDNQSKIVPDFNIGLFYNGQLTKKITFFAGYSMFHIFEPSVHFTTGASSEFYRRYVLHSGLEVNVAQRWTLYPGIIFMDDQREQELNLGLNVGYHIQKEADGRNTSIFFGGWFRATDVDAFIAMVGMEWKGIRAGFSYDVTTSPLKESNTDGAFEVSLIYTGFFQRITDNTTFLFCPRY